MNFKNYILILLSTAIILTGCTAPKKSANNNRPGGNTYKKPPKVVKQEEYLDFGDNITTRRPDGYIVSSGLSSNKKLNTVVDDWLGVPHKMGGKDKKGIDCSGFTTIVMRTVYKKDIVGSSADMALKCKEISRSQLQEGDLLFFKIGSSRVSHVGVYMSKGYFAHATFKKGVMISSLTEPYYEKYFSGSGRIL